MNDQDSRNKTPLFNDDLVDKYANEMIEALREGEKYTFRSFSRVMYQGELPGVRGSIKSHFVNRVWSKLPSKYKEEVN